MSDSHINRIVETMAHNRVRNYVLPGLSSFLVGGGDFGAVRLLTSSRDTREWVTPHSHRFDFTCLVLNGKVINVRFSRGGGEGSNAYVRGKVVPVNGGLGTYTIEREPESFSWVEERKTYVEGDTYAMKHDEIHSIGFGRGARVLFFEGPNLTDESYVLEPADHEGRAIETFTTAPWMFQRDGGTLIAQAPRPAKATDK